MPARVPATAATIKPVLVPPEALGVEVPVGVWVGVLNELPVEIRVVGSGNEELDKGFVDGKLEETEEDVAEVEEDWEEGRLEEDETEDETLETDEDEDVEVEEDDGVLSLLDDEDWVGVVVVSVFLGLDDGVGVVWVDWVGLISEEGTLTARAACAR